MAITARRLLLRRARWHRRRTEVEVQVPTMAAALRHHNSSSSRRCSSARTSSRRSSCSNSKSSNSSNCINNTSNNHRVCMRTAALLPVALPLLLVLEAEALAIATSPFRAPRRTEQPSTPLARPTDTPCPTSVAAALVRRAPACMADLATPTKPPATRRTAAHRSTSSNSSNSRRTLVPMADLRREQRHKALHRLSSSSNSSSWVRACRATRTPWHRVSTACMAARTPMPRRQHSRRLPSPRLLLATARRLLVTTAPSRRMAEAPLPVPLPETTALHHLPHELRMVGPSLCCHRHCRRRRPPTAVRMSTALLLVPAAVRHLRHTAVLITASISNRTTTHSSRCIMHSRTSSTSSTIIHRTDTTADPAACRIPTPHR